MDFRGPGLIARIAAPLKAHAQRFALVSLIIVALGLMVLGQFETRLVVNLRTAVTDIAAPVLEVASEPVVAVDRLVDHVSALTALHEENVRLRAEVERLRGWHAAARRLEAENKAFRGLLAYNGPPRHAFVSARIVADGHGPFVKSVLVNVGRRDSVAKGQAAVTALGLVGRVSEAGRRSARVLLLADLNSRVPVVIEDDRTRAILAGDNSSRPILVFLPASAKPRIGQRIVTSGHGGMLPAGIPVGVIDSADGGVYRVRLFVDGDRLEYVQIVNFDPVRAPSAAARPAPARPLPPGAGAAGAGTR